jgi:hypothetical protein
MREIRATFSTTLIEEASSPSPARAQKTPSKDPEAALVGRTRPKRQCFGLDRKGSGQNRLPAFS